MEGSRLEVRMPPAHRAELEALARQYGVSSSALAKIGIRWLLANPQTLLGRTAQRDGSEQGEAGHEAA